MQLGVPESLQKLYKQQLAAAYAETGNEAKALELTKSYIDQYGGDAAQLAYLARKALDAKNFEEAATYAQKAVDQTQQEGKKPSATYYNIMLNAYSQSGNLDKYYQTLERVAPILNQEIYWKPLIERAKKEPKYKPNDAQLDVYRTLEQAGVKLSPQDKVDMGELALNRGMASESERILAPLFKDGTLGGPSDKNAERSKRLYTKAQTDAKFDREGGLAQSEKDAAAKPTGEVYAITGESYMSAGNYDKAIEVMKKGLEKGQLEPGTEQLVKLRLGIAQFKAGQKDEARKTWSEVNGDNGSAWLARVWTSLSKV
jgi:tetratricopeptide (TPR) repeat protein